MNLTKWVRRPAPLDAVQVTVENMEEVAIWCGGPIRRDEKAKLYIAVPFKNPMGERRLRAYAGDYVLKIGHAYKIYTAKAFHETFQPADMEKDPLVVPYS